LAVAEAIGTFEVVPNEQDLHAITAVAGSGPAFLLFYLEKMIEAAVRVGLDRKLAKRLVLQTVMGSSVLAKISQSELADLRASVTSKNGTTAAGLHSLTSGTFEGSLFGAVEQALKRSKELESAREVADP